MARGKDRQHPTEEAPELGALELAGVMLTKGEHWVEDGDFVFRSTEFDVIAGAPTFDAALREFGANVVSFVEYLAKLDDPADNEVEMVRLAVPRLAEIVSQLKAANEADEDEAECEAPSRRSLRTATRERRASHHASRWLTTPRRRNSSRLSRA